MSKTTASLVAAFALIAVSVGVAATRYYVLGPEVDGPRGAGAWRVTLTVTGKLAETNRSVLLTLPRDFRRQHIFQERFRSKELVAHLSRRKASANRRAQWRARGPGPLGEVRLQYSFSCLLPLAQPSPGMLKLTERLDGPPHGFARTGKAEGMEIVRTVNDLVHQGMTERDKVRAFHDFVSALDTVPAEEERSARETLRERAGDNGGKARLLVALCRAAGIHARLVAGLVLVADQAETPLHYWAEAWVHDAWLPMDPTELHFGADGFPANFLVLQLGGGKIATSSGANLSLGFHAEHLADPGTWDTRLSPDARRLWQRLSLHGLRPHEQTLVKFLLFLPLAALIVSVFRTLIGVPTFGTFSPALLGLAFLDVKSLRWGLPIFIMLVLTGWGMRHFLERFHLLQVPRISALLTLIVGLLILIVVAAAHFGVAATQYISLFPLVILTHQVERFWTLEAEDGPMTSFRTLVGTVVVSVTVSLCLSPEAVTTWMFRYPETLGVTLGLQFLLGRYTGYRLAELYRFGDLVHLGGRTGDGGKGGEGDNGRDGAGEYKTPPTGGSGGEGEKEKGGGWGNGESPRNGAGEGGQEEIGGENKDGKTAGAPRGEAAGDGVPGPDSLLLPVIAPLPSSPSPLMPLPAPRLAVSPRRRWRGLQDLGILGMNQRNALYILDCNPRGSYPLVDSKEKMRSLCAAIGVPTPVVYATVAAHSALGKLPELLAERDHFVFKPNRGAGGRGILVVVGRQGTSFVRHNGQLLGWNEMRQHVSSIVSGLFSLGGLPDEALIQQRVLPHPAFEKIAFQGIADVRIIVYRGEPAMAMLRLPTRQSGGRANLHQGGIGVGVDLATGRTTRAVCRNRLTDRHPDTGASLVDFCVPHWRKVLDIAVLVSRAVPLGYLGVDIVLDRDHGPLLLEGNARPGLAIQIANGQGLLPRLKAIDARRR